MAAFIQIPKTMSSPADPNAPSFLTNLPPDIRNAVYEVIFKRDRPLLIHNPEAYHAIEPSRITMDPEYYDWQMRRYDNAFEADVGRDSEFQYGLHAGIQILGSCR